MVYFPLSRENAARYVIDVYLLVLLATPGRMMGRDSTPKRLFDCRGGGVVRRFVGIAMTVSNRQV